jgi:PAS domain S-box-containing protein
MTYKTIFENVGVATAVIDEDMTIALANSEFLRLFERPRQAIVGAKWTEFISRKEIEKMGHFRAAKPKGSVGQYEFTWVGRDARIKQIAAIVSLAPGSKKYLVSLLDVTDQRRAEEALWESEENFRTIFERAAIGISLVDVQEGRILVSNPAMQKLLGYSSKELFGMRFTEFTHPEDVEHQMSLYREMAAGKLMRFELKKRYIRKGGEIICARLVASLALGTSGRPSVIIGMIEEMAEPANVRE